MGIFPAIAFLLGALPVFAQVHCSLALKPGGKLDTHLAILTVSIEPGWHIASLTQPDGDPLRTTIELAKDQAYRLAGPISGPTPHREHCAAFGVDVETHEGEVQFAIPLERNPDAPKSADPSKVTFEVTYQACNEETCQRRPSTEPDESGKP